MIIAFSGWNDAAEAATGATSHILGAWTDAVHAVDDQVGVVPELIADIDPEEFYDFQVNRTYLARNSDLWLGDTKF
jgi:hypothetical protein